MICFITGGAQGIGFETARELLSKGHQVCLFDLTDPAEAASALQGDVMAVQGDVTRKEDIDAAIDKTVDRFGGLDCVVTAAGIVKVGPSVDVDPDDFARTMAINVTGSFLTAQSGARHMVASGGGNIVFVGSVYGEGGAPQRASYCASKGAVHNLTRSLAVEWAPMGIRVNAVAPTGVRTPMVQNLIDQGIYDMKGVKNRTPLGRIAEPAEVASAIEYLASPGASMITGVILPVDGGWTANGYITG